jgi:hypothetical protein
VRLEKHRITQGVHPGNASVNEPDALISFVSAKRVTNAQSSSQNVNKMS